MSENGEQGSIWGEQPAAGDAGERPAGAAGEGAAEAPADEGAGAGAPAGAGGDAPAAQGGGPATDGGRGEKPAAPRETPRPAPLPRPIAPKEYYSISEVCELVGLKPHVLRYWESQFPVLNPSKNRSGNRVYQRKEIKLILLVAHLLYKEKYTIEGARQKIDQLRRGGELPETTGQVLDHEMLDLLRAELQQVMALLAPGDES